MKQEFAVQMKLLNLLIFKILEMLKFWIKKMALFKNLPFFDYQQRNKISLYLLLRKFFRQNFSH